MIKVLVGFVIGVIVSFLGSTMLLIGTIDGWWEETPEQAARREKRQAAKFWKKVDKDPRFAYMRR